MIDFINSGWLVESLLIVATQQEFPLILSQQLNFELK